MKAVRPARDADGVWRHSFIHFVSRPRSNAPCLSSNPGNPLDALRFPHTDLLVLPADAGCTGEEAVFMWRLRRVETEIEQGGDMDKEHEDTAAAVSTSSSQSLPDLTPSPSRVVWRSQAESCSQEVENAGCAESPWPGASALDRNWSRGGGGACSGGEGAGERVTAGDERHVKLLPTADAEEKAEAASPSGRSAQGGLGEAEAVAFMPPPRSSSSSPSAAAQAAAALPRGLEASLSSSSRQLPSTWSDREAVTAWMVESIQRDDSADDEELPVPGPAGRGSHPRCSPELVVKAQLAALRRGDVAGAASFNIRKKSTSVGGNVFVCASGGVSRIGVGFRALGGTEKGTWRVLRNTE